MAASNATDKERFLSKVQSIIDYCVRLLTSDTVNSDIASNILTRLHRLEVDIVGVQGSLISAEESNDLLSIINDMCSDVERKFQSNSSDDASFRAERKKEGQLGAPKFSITKEQLEFLISYKFTAPLMAETLKTSESTIRRRLREYGIKLREGRQTVITDVDLDQKIKEIIGTNRRIGPNSIRLRLEIDDVYVSRERVRDSCHRVDPAGCALRSIERQNIQRRTYKVAGPNSLWHIDGNHKLVRWGFYIHGGIDGFSRLVTFLQCNTDNKSTTVYDAFTLATQKHGIPSRIRVDCGVENVDICTFMQGYRGLNRGSAIRGKSAHNQRIERLWVDVWDAVSNEYYDLFTFMEDSEILDITNIVHLWAVHFVFKPRLNKSLEIFKYQYNNHGLSTENYRTPHQIFIQGVLRNMCSDNVAISEFLLTAGDEGHEESVTNDYGVEDDDEESEQESFVFNEHVQDRIECPLNDEELQNLNDSIDILSQYKNVIHGVQLFKDVLLFIESVATPSDDV